MVFLINYHYYSFYIKNYKMMYQVTKTSQNLLTDQYYEFQKFHPFADLFLLAQNSNNHNVHYLFARYNKESILEDELFIRVNYFFYPRIIKPVNDLKIFLDLKFDVGDLIVTDHDLTLESLGHRLKPISVSDISTLAQDFFFRREKPYYLFEVVR